VRILLVRLRLIGDVVFTTPLIRALRRRYPHARLDYLVEPAAAPIVTGNPHLNEVIVAPKPRGLARLTADLRLARSLRSARYDVVIDMHGGPRSGWLTWASAAPRRIGYDIKGRGWMYTSRVARAPDLRPRHSVRNQWDLLAPLGISPPDPAVDAVEMGDDAAAAARADTRLRAAGIGPGTPVVVMHVSAGNPFRRWPEASFQAVTEALARRDPARRILLTSGPSDAEAARQIASRAREALGDLAAAVPDLGDFDLHELRSIIARAAVYIGGDSGPLHVAATTTVPVVALLGPTLPERSKPWRDPRYYVETLDHQLPCRPCHQRVCEPGDFRCLTWTSAEQVIKAAERAIEAGAARGGRA
jgi:predicted lipopolysaccharide heptosyltransferase III